MRSRGFCQDGPVSTQRTLTALTLLTLALAGCGGGPATPSADPTWMATPQFDATASATGAPSASPSTAAAAPSTTLRPNATPTGAQPTAPGTKKPVAPPAKSRTVTTTADYVFPVKASNVSWHKTHGKYRATDIFANCGKPVLAVTDGVVLEVSLKDRYVKGRPDGPLNGGLSVSLLGDDGVRYYGSHLSKVQKGIKAGVEVTAGQQLGLVGKTGNANGVCHLHFGISPKCAGTGDWKVRRGVVWPYSYLDSWRKKGSKSPVSAVSDWKKAHNCKA
jgi:murein DD-endopeptidase MepM/ murein hydrolase activator NlpD